jgi:hypothetical protein
VNYLKTIRAATNRRFKINVSFGFILKHRATEELRFFHPSNNTLLFETPMLVANETDQVSWIEWNVRMLWSMQDSKDRQRIGLLKELFV